MPPTAITPARLDELERLASEAAERASKATPGPWEATPSGYVYPPEDVDRDDAEHPVLDAEILIAHGTAKE